MLLLDLVNNLSTINEYLVPTKELTEKINQWSSIDRKSQRTLERLHILFSDECRRASKSLDFAIPRSMAIPSYFIHSHYVTDTFSEIKENFFNDVVDVCQLSIIYSLSGWECRIFVSLLKKLKTYITTELRLNEFKISLHLYLGHQQIPIILFFGTYLWKVLFECCWKKSINIVVNFPELIIPNEIPTPHSDIESTSSSLFEVRNTPQISPPSERGGR